MAGRLDKEAPRTKADIQKHQLALHRLCSTAHGHREGREGRVGDRLVRSGKGRERARARWCYRGQRAVVVFVAAVAVRTRGGVARERLSRW